MSVAISQGWEVVSPLLLFSSCGMGCCEQERLVCEGIRDPLCRGKREDRQEEQRERTGAKLCLWVAVSICTHRGRK